MPQGILIKAAITQQRILLVSSLCRFALLLLLASLFVFVLLVTLSCIKTVRCWDVVCVAPAQIRHAGLVRNNML